MDKATKEKATLFAALNLPCSNSSERTFYQHQETIGKGIRAVTTDIIKEAMNLEIKTTILDGVYDKKIAS